MFVACGGFGYVLDLLVWCNMVFQCLVAWWFCGLGDFVVLVFWLFR